MGMSAAIPRTLGLSCLVGIAEARMAIFEDMNDAKTASIIVFKFIDLVVGHIAGLIAVNALFD